MLRTIPLLLAVSLFAADDKIRTITFSKDDAGKVPSGWTSAKTGKGEGSVWKVVADESAPSKKGYVLAQTAVGPNPLFNLCVLDESSHADLEATVSFKAIKGEKDQGGGILWRYQDANNYYVARFNPLEDNLRVYKIVAGQRNQLGTAEVSAAAGKWHTMKISMKGDRIECHLNGRKHLEVKDSAIQKAGKVGLWAKADAHTYFDELKIQGK
jgi:hypothetical protein